MLDSSRKNVFVLRRDCPWIKPPTPREEPWAIVHVHKRRSARSAGRKNRPRRAQVPFCHKSMQHTNDLWVGHQRGGCPSPASLRHASCTAPPNRRHLLRFALHRGEFGAFQLRALCHSLPFHSLCHHALEEGGGGGGALTKGLQKRLQIQSPSKIWPMSKTVWTTAHRWWC